MNDALLRAAQEARANAYAPYSNFAVGAAVLHADGSVSTGANIENASYGLSLCAERAAIASARSAGRHDVVEIAVAGPEGELCVPCGACRQFIREFGAHIRIWFTTPHGPLGRTIAELLPEAFTLAHSQQK